MKKAFTLIEMLVVIGIISILAVATVSSVAKLTRVAHRARCQELVANTSVALLAFFQQNGGVWSKGLIQNNDQDAGLDEMAARSLAQGRYLSLDAVRDGRGRVTRLKGYDRFGVVSPWATAKIKRAGKQVNLDTPVPSGGKIRDHVLRYSLDLDGDGLLEAHVGGEKVAIRANVAVWCCGKDGKIERYSVGERHDDVYSWVVGQTREVHQ